LGDVAGPRVVTGAASSQGACTYQEDRYAVATEGSTTLLGVFDGHAGFKAAEYARKHLLANVLQRLTSQADVGAALVDAYKETDAGFLRKLEECGSTAVVAAVAGRMLWVANAGDSRCVLGMASGAAIALSHDHKPDDPVERARIEAAGHEVLYDSTVEDGRRVRVARVDGQIACARGLGDGDMKDYGIAPEAQAITCVPDVVSRKLLGGRSSSPDATESFVLLACDGVWDVMTNEEAVSFVAARLAELRNKQQPITQAAVESIAQQLVDHAVNDLGSMDNTTALLGVFV